MKEKSAEKAPDIQSGGNGKNRNIMYVQQLAYLPGDDKTLDAVAERIEKCVKPEKYAIILHDKDLANDDDCTEPHIHAMMTFKHARHLSKISKELDEKNTQPLRLWKGNANNGYAYLIHATKKAQGKYQYPVDAVRANFDYAAEMQKISGQVATANSKKRNDIDILLDALYDGQLSKSQLEERLTGSQIAKYSRQIETVWSKRLQKLAAEFRREMIEQGRTVKTMWIYGPTETGKTSLAREYAEKTGHEVFVSGSSRDIFQDYAGQHTVILDELRPGNLSYSDLLRITDPYGRDASAPSRYFDKALAVEYIIITSPYNPFEFYIETFAQCKDRSKMDGFGQLLRRLSVVIETDPYTINAVEYWEKHDKFRMIPNTTRENPYSAFGRQAPDAKENAVKLYNSIFENIAEEPPD